MKVVCGTVGEDEHSVGLSGEIINIKHGGIEKWGIECGIPRHFRTGRKDWLTLVVEENAQAILASTIISHDNVHYKNMKQTAIELCDGKRYQRQGYHLPRAAHRLFRKKRVKTGIDDGIRT